MILKAIGVGTALAQEGGGPNPTAGGPQPTAGNAGQITLFDPLRGATFLSIVQNIIGWLFTLSIPIVSIMVMVGGYYILTSGGNEERLIRGRRTIIYAVIGFAVILISGGVVSLIRELTGI